jgi:hypothetical protein
MEADQDLGQPLPTVLQPLDDNIAVWSETLIPVVAK